MNFIHLFQSHTILFERVLRFFEAEILALKAKMSSGEIEERSVVESLLARRRERSPLS